MKFIAQPPAAHEFPKPLACTLANIHSFAPPAAFGFGTSVTGEHPVVALDSAGPATAAPIVPALIGIRYNVGGPPVFPHTDKFPVAVPDPK